MFTTLISADDLYPHINDPDWLVVDCRYSLTDSGLGQRNYQQSHIPGAIYAHVDADLSAPVVPGKTGRHPLPPADQVAALFSRWGVDADVQVVVYDDATGGVAARLWWMFRWLGHEAVAVLDGGWKAWQEGNFPVTTDVPERSPRTFVARPQMEWVVDAPGVATALRNPQRRVIDARAAERYTGEVETIDPVAGHIPGAINAPYMDNLDEKGRFKSPAELREQYDRLLAGSTAGTSIAYCGSGVTACHTLLAMKHAGLGDGRLYAGSWSDWITDTSRKIATGEK